VSASSPGATTERAALVNLIARRDIVRRLTRLFVLTATLAILPSVAPARAAELLQAANDVQPVDKELFILHALQHIYDTWPVEFGQPTLLSKQLKNIYAIASALKTEAQDNRFDSRIVAACDDCMSLVSGYETYLVDVGAIERRDSLQASQDLTGSTTTAFRGSAAGASALKDEGYSNGESILGGVAVGLVGAAIDNYFRSQARDAEKQEQMTRARNDLDHRITEVNERTKVRVAAIESDKGWAVGEAGHDGFNAKRMGEMMKHRPHDLFLIVHNAQLRQENETPDAIGRDANACADAAAKVPAGRAYDVFRANFLESAADTMVLAAVSQLGGNYSSAPAGLGKDACRYCDAYLAATGADRDYGNMLLARAKAAAGEVGEAINAANKVDKSSIDGGYAYRYAKLMSMSHQAQKSLEWLQYSFKLGFDGVAHAKVSPDFAFLRDTLSDDFASAVKVSYEWTINWGYRISDDTITVTNNSDFPLTNVVLSPTVKSSGYDDWTTTLKCDRIAPHSQHTWTLGVTAISSRGDDAKGTASLNCDQQ
jgi:hypothetical protein